MHLNNFLLKTIHRFLKLFEALAGIKNWDLNLLQLLDLN